MKSKTGWSRFGVSFGLLALVVIFLFFFYFCLALVDRYAFVQNVPSQQ